MRLDANNTAGPATAPADADDGSSDDSHGDAAPAALRVVANSNVGLYLVDRRAVKCLCPRCVEIRRQDPANIDYVVSPTEFERHSGIPTAKKWRFSIKVAHGDEPEIPLGRWLELKGLDHKMPKRALVTHRPVIGAFGPPAAAAFAAAAAAATAAAAARQQHHGAPCALSGERPGVALAHALERAAPKVEASSSADDSSHDHHCPDDAAWMQSPCKPRGPRGAAAAAAHRREAAAEGSCKGEADAGKAAAAVAVADGGKPPSSPRSSSDTEDAAIRVGPGFQACLPPWRPRPALRAGSPAAQAMAAAAVASDLARAGPRGPTEQQAAIIAVQERLRAESLPPDAVDDLWERREPALALERGHRTRRAPGWMQDEQYIHTVAGHAGGRAGGGRGAGGGGFAEDDDEEEGREELDDGAYSSDHERGSGRHSGRKRVSSNSAHSGSSGPLLHGMLQPSMHPHQQQHLQRVVAAAAASAALQRTHSRLGAAAAGSSGGASNLHQALAAAARRPDAPHIVEWRTQDGAGALEVAMVLAGQVFVGRLASRGPLADWLPPALAQSRPAGQQQACAPAPSVEEPAAAPAGAEDQRHCALCAGGAGARLGPFMPVQIQNGQLEWVHRDCALWSPEVSVDNAGRLVGLAAAVRRGIDTACAHCGGRGATLSCWCRRSCDQELHLPCAREAGCHLSDASDSRFGGCRLVACPAHTPGTPGFDAAAALSEVHARDDALRAATAASAAASGEAAGAAAAAAGAVAARAAAEEVEAAELLTGIKRSSVTGSGDLGALDPHTQGPAAKRRRSADGGGWGDGARGCPGDGGLHAHAHVAAATAKRRPLVPQPPAGAGDAAAAPHPGLHVTPQLPAAPPLEASAPAPAPRQAPPSCGLGGGAGLLQALQPALLGAPGGAGAAAGVLGDLLTSAGAAALGGTTGHAGRPGRCAVCVVQRKGKCGTDSAPKKCIRRQQQLLDAQLLQRKLRQQLSHQQDQLLLEQLQMAARYEAKLQMQLNS